MYVVLGVRPLLGPLGCAASVGLSAAEVVSFGDFEILLLGLSSFGDYEVLLLGFSGCGCEVAS